MINLYGAQIETLSVHKVGNRAKNEGTYITKAALKLTDETTVLLKEYFFKSFREKEEQYYCFDDDVELNPVHSSVLDAFTEDLHRPNVLHSLSIEIANHLYVKSNHPHIKSGDLYVCYITNIVLDNVKVNAIGIFKSEIKEDFIQLVQNGNNLDMVIQQGINVNKLDKGCLILDVNQNEGYKVMSIDNNRYDSKYWIENFLGLSVLAEDHYLTKKYLELCKNFSKEVVSQSGDKQDEVLFLNRAVNHFAKNDTFNELSFLEDTFSSMHSVAMDFPTEFVNYKATESPKYGLEGVTDFDIADNAVTEARKKIKTTITLDKRVTIKMDFINPDTAEKIVEKGWDEERQMYYYLVYFHKED